MRRPLGSAASQAAGLAGANPARAAGASGTIADLKHVVILMQENRSFDHYYGSLRGVRGFSDKQVLKYQDGTTIFDQPDTKRTDLGYLLPFHMDSTKVDAQNAGDLDHSWAGDHSARNSGLWNNWTAAKTEQTMGYFTRNDLPFNYALADAFTICDGYHQSILGPTSPNRMYFWTGTSHGFTDNPPDYTVEFTNVTTYPELLLKAGVSWQVYTNHEVGDGSGADGWVGDYGDNPLWFYQQYQTSEKATTTAGQQLAVQGAVQPWQPNAGTPLGPNHVNHVLAQFIADCAAGKIPQVSWIVAPYEYSEHPAASPSYGAHYVRTVLEALMGNQALWETTALFITYDEHDGYFDHVLPGSPETTVTDEFIGGLPIGFGPRVPMIICSPWTRGGFVDSNSYDHTSMLRFLESLDRRQGSQHHGLAAFGDRRPGRGLRLRQPGLLHPRAAGHGAADHPVGRGEVLPRRRPRPPRARRPCRSRRPGTRPHRPSQLMPHADVTINRSAHTVTATMSNTGKVGVSLMVFPDKYLTASATPFTVVKRHGQDLHVDRGASRTSTGTPSRSTVPTGSSARSPATSSPRAPPPGRSPGGRDAGTGHARSLRLTLANDGTTAVAYTLTVNDYAGATQTVTVGANGSRERHVARRRQRLLRRDRHREHERRLHPPLRGPDRVNGGKSRSISRTDPCYTRAGRLNAASPIASGRPLSGGSRRSEAHWAPACC